jgi:Sortase domain
MGYSEATGPLPAVPCLPDDWWDPAWQAAQTPGVTGLEPVICEAAAPAAPPETPLAWPEPSWSQVLATTIGLGRSRHLSWLRRRLVAVAALVVGVVAIAVGSAGLVLAPASAAPPVPRPTAIPAPPGPAALPATLAMSPATARPVWLSVPVLGVRTTLVDLGLNKNGTLQVPSSTAVAGWFTGSPRPGAVGSAIIAGHVDSRTGPGIFFWLRTLHPGDRVYVGRADGTMAVFTVTTVQMYAKDQFPTAAVYGPVPDAELRLITCGGVFDRSLRSYLSNVVVFARLTG